MNTEPKTQIELCPKCETELSDAAGIGQYCPNSTCDVLDNINLYKKDYIKRMVTITDCV